MSSLKQLRTRISSVRGTRRITAAMKMVAIARLRKSQEKALSARPYAKRAQALLAGISSGAQGRSLPEMMAGRMPNKSCLMVVIMTDRGLCGGLNTNLRRLVLAQAEKLRQESIQPKLLLVGRKSTTLLSAFFKKEDILATFENLVMPQPDAEQAERVCAQLIEHFDNKTVDSVQLYYNNFLSAMTQTPSSISLIPFTTLIDDQIEDADSLSYTKIYDFEPGKTEVLKRLAPQIITIQVYRALIESFASEQAARMTAMDSATRNAEKMIEQLSLNYNRLRQATITRELIEIVSGAEAL